MSFSAIFYILGWVITFFGSAMMIPAITSFFYGDQDVNAFIDTATAAMFFGGLLILMNRDKEPVLTHKDGFLLTFLIWVSTSIVGALPFYISGVTPHLADALFESVSGLTTTGASVLSGLDAMDHGILLWRAILQWMGGMGIVVLAVAVLPFLGIGGLQLYRSEMPGVTNDKLQPRLKETAKLLWLVYMGFTFSCAIVYWVLGMSAFDAITHAFATISTGGYSTHDASMGFWQNPAIELAACVFMFIGGSNFTLHYLFLLRGRFSIYLNDPEVRFYFGSILAAIFFFTITLMITSHYESFWQSLRYSIFNAVTVATTTGFGVTDYNMWPVFTHIIVMALMFVGGTTGSTGGGLKVLRFMMILKQAKQEIDRLLHPHGVTVIKIGRQRVEPQIMQAIWSFAGFFVLSFVTVAMSLSAYGIDLVTAFSAAAAALTSLGPGLGEVGPASNYAHLPAGAKLILAFAMLLGRLELFTVLIIFTPNFWRK